MSDVSQLTEMGLRFINETSYAGKIQKNPTVIRELLIKLMSSAVAMLVVNCDYDGKLNGMLGAFVFYHPISGEKVAGEMFWWMEPEARGAGVRLYKYMEQWAKAMGATRLQMVAPTAKVGDFYRRLGFYEVETTFQRDLA